MAYSLLSEKTVAARKPHRCIWCGEPIATGDKYVRERSVFDGNMQNFPWHPECRRDSWAQSADYEFEFEPYQNSRPEFRLPEGALA